MKFDEKKIERWDLILYNDPMHSFEYVVDTLCKYIPLMDKETAAKHAIMIHMQQTSVIYSGLKEHVEHFSDQIQEDWEQNKKILLPPLSTEIIPNLYSMRKMKNVNK
jgi:ATP-dependent Clp protease adapter protein ClpS